MKVYNPTFKTLHTDIIKTISDVRNKRDFNVEKYINKKTNLINNYLRHCNLSSCVVAVSGGIDSAIVLGLVAKAAKKTDSPIKKIVSVCLPVYQSAGVTGQDDATKRGIEVIKKFNLEPTVIDLSETHQTLVNAVDNGVKAKGDNWATGQVASYVRTPVLYYITSHLTQAGTSGLLCGTTNRDEGAYLGYVGKASDGMVDLQIISDLHKSEVYKIAKALDVPTSIINATPSGDMFDGRVDEEVFGAPYDFVELYLNYLTYTEEEKKNIFNSLCNEAQSQFTELQSHLEALHKYNGHKYLVDSPAIHLDIYDSAVPNGWNDNRQMITDRSGFKF